MRRLTPSAERVARLCDQRESWYNLVIRYTSLGRIAYRRTKYIDNREDANLRQFNYERVVAPSPKGWLPK